MTRAAIRFGLCSAIVCLTAAVTLAQTSTTAETKKFQVISVSGNTLVVSLPEGTREITVPADFRFNVDGKMLSVQELKPGMAGTATITTRTTVTPVTVTEVKNGIVMQNTGSSIIVRNTDDNTIRMFSEADVTKRNISITRDGQRVNITDLRPNNRVSATIVTSMPPRVMTEQEVQATLAKSAAGAGTSTAAGTSSAARPAAAAAAAGAAASGSESGAGASGAEPRTLPRTASPLPILGLTGLASLLAGLGLTIGRRARR